MKKKPAGKKQFGGIVFDGDTNVRGNVVSGEVHGNVSYSNVETNIQQGLTAQELAQIQQLFLPVRETIAHADLPENKRILGQEYADQLEKEITKKDEPPDESIIKVAGNWLLENIPEIAGAPDRPVRKSGRGKGGPGGRSGRQRLGKTEVWKGAERKMICTNIDGISRLGGSAWLSCCWYSRFPAEEQPLHRLPSAWSSRLLSLPWSIPRPSNSQLVYSPK